jgi:hypothetical protein
MVILILFFTKIYHVADSMIEEGNHRANSLLIKKQMPKKCQSLLFSATFPPEVVTFATKMVDNPDKILIEDGDEFLVSIFVQFNDSPLSLSFSLTHETYCSAGCGCHQTTMDRYSGIRRWKIGVSFRYLLSVDDWAKHCFCGDKTGCRQCTENAQRFRLCLLSLARRGPTRGKRCYHECLPSRREHRFDYNQRIGPWCRCRQCHDGCQL